MTISKKTVEKISKVLDRVDTLEVENIELKRELDSLKEFNEKLIEELNVCKIEKNTIARKYDKLKISAISTKTILEEVEKKLIKQISKEEKILDLETEALMKRIDRYA